MHVKDEGRRGIVTFHLFNKKDKVNAIIIFANLLIHGIRNEKRGRVETFHSLMAVKMKSIRLAILNV